MNQVTVVIPNYNGEALLSKNLPSVLKFCKECEVIVVDDCSTDGSVAMLGEKFPSVQVIRHEKNHGFSTTVNDGFKKASGKLILLLNTDVSLTEDIIKRLYKYFSNPDVFGVGCLQRTKTSNDTGEEGVGEGVFRKGFLIHKKGNIHGKKTLWVFGGAGMFRKNIWSVLGGLESLYEPFYWEDIDISYRALKAGYTIVFDPDTYVIHDKSSGSISSSYSQKKITSISYRNQYFFVWLNISDKYFLLQHAFFIPIHIFQSIISLNTPHIRGFLSAIVHLPLVLQHRWQYRKYWKISDGQILKETASERQK